MTPAATTSPPAAHNATLASAPETRGGGEISPPERTAPPVRPHLGAAGPAEWPDAFQDVVGYALWPKQYAGALRAHGVGDVLAAAFPATAGTASVARNGVRQARADQQTTPEASCSGWNVTASDWPIDPLSSTLDLNDTQKANLDQLRTSLSEAMTAIKASCRNAPGQTPVDRLRAMQTSLWAVHDAAQLIRAPLATFYDSLTQDQKAQFDADQPRTADGAAARPDMAKLCDMPSSLHSPIHRIEQSLHPSKAQHASLDALQKKSSEMGQFLMASCLKPIPATPAERLDAAADRLTAVIFAASNINMALNEFTSKLTNEQKSMLAADAR